MLKYIAATAAVLLAACGSVDPELSEFQEAEKLAQPNLANFDDLDYNVFSEPEVDRAAPEPLHRDITVHWPDGHSTKGIEKHIEDLKAMFAWAPDTRILEHPVKLGQGEWTAVIGIMEGTFTQ